MLAARPVLVCGRCEIHSKYKFWQGQSCHVTSASGGWLSFRCRCFL
nr:MAG TPA: hypothetical protein [Caudoviricetes sp.]